MYPLLGWLPSFMGGRCLTRPQASHIVARVGDDQLREVVVPRGKPSARQANLTWPRLGKLFGINTVYGSLGGYAKDSTVRFVSKQLCSAIKKTIVSVVHLVRRHERAFSSELSRLESHQRRGSFLTKLEQTSKRIVIIAQDRSCGRLELIPTEIG